MTTLNRNVAREKCGKCTKQIYLGQSAIVCSYCDLIFHSLCLNEFKIFRDKIYCSTCISNHDIVRYNPFYTSNRSDDQHDRFYNDDVTDFTDTFDNASQILEECKQYTITEANLVLKTKSMALNNEKNLHPFSNLFFNIDGNETNFDKFACFLKSIDFRFSVIGLAETNTDKTNKDLYKINGYTSCYQQVKEDKQKGTGVCLYIDDTYNFSELADSSLTTNNLESIFVKITNLEEPTIVGAVYRPPSGDINAFHLELSDILSNLPADHSVHILGDFNIDLLSETHCDTSEFENTIFSAGYIPQIAIHTHHRDKCRKTCIDNIITNNPEQAIVSGTIKSDTFHKPIFQMCYVKSGIEAVSQQKTKIYYDYSQKNLDKFCEALINTINEMNVVENFEDFVELFNGKVDQTCKLDIPRLTKRTSIDNPWITSGIVTSIIEKIKLYDAWTKSKSIILPDGDPTKYNSYKEHRKILCKTIKLAKKSYYGQKFEKCKTDPRKTWGLINDLRGKSKTPTKPSFVIGNERITCRRNIATKFNEYFVSLASNLNASIEFQDGLPVSGILPFSHYLSNKVESSIYLYDTCSLEIEDIIKEFENGKASDIPTILIKKSAKIISPTLARLYNFYMNAGNFPEIFKIGKINPIFKKGNKEVMENYRPVSILPIFGKIFEKIIYNRLYNYFAKENVISENQFGFRKLHSTVHALHSSVRKIEAAMENGFHTIGIFIDLSKAFDTLDHNIMLHKLDYYGIRGVAKQLLESYLRGRKQYTAFDGECSEKQMVHYGVPQGSILGPLLFLLYINDLVNCYDGENTKFILYADDTNIFVVGQNKDEAFSNANKVLEKVHAYMKCNLLHINMDKCCFIHFQPSKNMEVNSCSRTIPFVSNNHVSKAIYIDGKKLKEVDDAKFLGVIIDKNLNWTAHINNLCKKLRAAAALLSKIRHWIPEKHYSKVYHALFEAHLTYGISVWGGVYDSKLNKIFQIQKHCVRILFGDRESYLDKFKTCARARQVDKGKLGAEFHSREHTKPLFREQKVLTVKNLYYYFCAIEIFKILKFRLPISLYEMYNLSNRDSSMTILTPKQSIQFFYKSAVAWNRIYKRILARPHMDLTTKISHFKTELKKLLLLNQNDGDEIEWQKSNFNLV